jgi:hypothetical protein
VRFYAGGTFSGQFSLCHPTTGAAADADSLPVAVATRNTVLDPGFTLAVVRSDLGLYTVFGTIPGTYAEGDWVSVSVSATVDGVQAVLSLETFRISAATTAASDPLANALAGPKRARGDAGEVEQHPIPDLIEADKYLASKAAANKPGRGLRFTTLIPDGTVNRGC